MQSGESIRLDCIVRHRVDYPNGHKFEFLKNPARETMVLPRDNAATLHPSSTMELTKK
jgi:hypothetical protein